MKKIWIIICFISFLLFAIGTVEKVFSMNIEKVESLCPTSDNTEFVDMSDFYHQLVAVEINEHSSRTQGLNTIRLKRTVSLHIANFFKNLHRNLSRLDSAFAHNDIRAYHTINSPYSTLSGKYYYVFTLRHIII